VGRYHRADLVQISADLAGLCKTLAQTVLIACCRAALGWPDAEVHDSLYRQAPG
jgi:hypothetical protein